MPPPEPAPQPPAGHPDPGPPLTSGLPGRILFKFREPPNLGYSDSPLMEFPPGFRARFAQARERFPGLGLALPHFNAVAPSRLDALVQGAEAGWPLADEGFPFRCYYSAFVPATADLRAVAAWFEPAEEFGLAYVAPDARGEGGKADSADPHEAFQIYWRAAPVGVDRDCCLGRPGGDGAGPRLGVLGLGFDPAHPEGFSHVSHVHGVLSHADEDIAHGNATLGILCAAQNGRGVAGAACAATPVLYASALCADGAHDIANALLALTDRFGSGDVIQIELQTAQDPALPQQVWHWPVEVSESIRKVIALAAARGIAVVEPAGNGNHDLDAFNPHPTLRGFLPVSRSFKGAQDSGAILVGACTDTEDATVSPRRWTSSPAGSNHGSRVDCFGPGELVYSCWHHVPGDQTRFVHPYGAFLNATSSAAAVVAAAALLTSARSRFAVPGGSPFDGWRIRELLTDPGNTPSHDPPTDRIGVMPDLRWIAVLAGLP